MGGPTHAILWDVDGKLHDLDAWLDSVNPADGSRWTLSSAQDINDAGFVVGYGYHDGQQKAFILDATSIVPEPSLCAILIGGTFALGLARRRSKSR